MCEEYGINGGGALQLEFEKGILTKIKCLPEKKGVKFFCGFCDSIPNKGLASVKLNQKQLTSVFIPVCFKLLYINSNIFYKKITDTALVINGIDFDKQAKRKLQKAWNSGIYSPLTTTEIEFLRNTYLMYIKAGFNYYTPDKLKNCVFESCKNSSF